MYQAICHHHLTVNQSKLLIPRYLHLHLQLHHSKLFSLVMYLLILLSIERACVCGILLFLLQCWEMFGTLCIKYEGNIGFILSYSFKIFVNISIHYNYIYPIFFVNIFIYYNYIYLFFLLNISIYNNYMNTVKKKGWFCDIFDQFY